MLPIPDHHKPDAPGLHMGFDNTVSLYHVVGAEESFEDAAGALFGLLREAQQRYPGWPRVVYLDIEGHRGDVSGFEENFVELQQEFFFSVIAPFVTAFDTPLTGGLVNPDPQRDDVPDRLRLAGEHGE